LSDEIVVYSQPGALERRNPRHVLAEASEAAVALKEVIDARPKKLVLGGETYLQIEDWCTVGHFYNYVPSLVEDRYVEYGGAQGWEATAAVRRISDGVEISRATAMCLNDEENWSMRPSYEWHYVTRTMGTVRDDPGREEIIWEPGQNGKNRPKKVKVQVGEEPVPQHQLRSMAQTSNVLRFVPVLAGYKGTPAEEMSGRWEDDRSERGDPPAPSPAAGTPPAAQEPRQRRTRAKGKDEGPPPAAEPQEVPAESRPVDDRFTVKPQRTKDEWHALHRAAEASGLDEKSVSEHMKLLYPGRNYNQLSDREATEMLAWAQGPRPADRGYEADHFVSPDRLPGVKVNPPATVGEVLQRHGYGQQAPAQQAVEAGTPVSDEVARQVRNLAKWAENPARPGQSIDHVKGACMSAFGAGLEAVLTKYGKPAYTVLMDWAAEDDQEVDRDKVLERAAMDIKEGRQPA
jgi:hypothetical protein